MPSIRINFTGIGQPTERMVECMKWITSIFPLRQDLEEYEEAIWWDYKLASKFIGANIDRTKEEQYRRRNEANGKRFYSQSARPLVQIHRILFDDIDDDENNWLDEMYPSGINCKDDM